MMINKASRWERERSTSEGYTITNESHWVLEGFEGIFPRFTFNSVRFQVPNDNAASAY